jgi:phospholipid/cholesterol/gamma-HCH transport system permease protein
MEEKAPEISPSPDGVIRCEGNWTLYHLAGLERRIAALPWPQLAELVWELSGVVAMDPSGAWLLHRTVNELERKGQRVRLQGLSPDLAGLLEPPPKTGPDGM